MIKARRDLTFALLAGLSAAAASAAPLVITKTSQTVSDPVGNLLPKAIPGALIDYTISITNPVANGLTAVNGIYFSIVIPTKTKLCLADLGPLFSGPVAFTAGTSLLSYGFTALTSGTDGLDFSSDGGTTWTYQPIADSDGCDAAVTNVRVKMTGTQLAASTASIRFRVKLK